MAAQINKQGALGHQPAGAGPCPNGRRGQAPAHTPSAGQSEEATGGPQIRDAGCDVTTTDSQWEGRTQVAINKMAGQHGDHHDDHHDEGTGPAGIEQHSTEDQQLQTRTAVNKEYARRRKTPPEEWIAAQKQYNDETRQTDAFPSAGRGTTAADLTKTVNNRADELLRTEYDHPSQSIHSHNGEDNDKSGVPEFLQHMEYPVAPDDEQKDDPLEEDITTQRPDIEAVLCPPETPAAIPTLDTTKWPFPHRSVDAETASIYDAVRASGCHNHEGAMIPLMTALKVPTWRQEVTGHKDDETVMQGIQYGFPIQYCGPPQYGAAPTRNHPSAINHKRHIQDYVAEELKHGAIKGPFHPPPFVPWCVTSPLMTREKADSSSRRIIVDLSFQDEGLNKYIIPHVFNGVPAEHNLPTIESAVRTISAMCPGGVVMAVIDLSRAYRQFPVSPLDWPLLGMMVDQQQYFDLRLPFGARMSSFAMQTIANFIVRALTTRGIRAHMYLDDINIVCPNQQVPVVNTGRRWISSRPSDSKSQKASSSPPQPKRHGWESTSTSKIISSQYPRKNWRR